MRSTSEYRIWSQMKNRCLNKNARAYQDYGGRGIDVCEEWVNSFEAFVSDMGRRPSPHHTLDRIDNSLGYKKTNCRWALWDDQAHNRRGLVLNADIVEVFRTLHRCGWAIAELSQASGINISTMSKAVRGETWLERSERKMGRSVT